MVLGFNIIFYVFMMVIGELLCTFNNLWLDIISTVSLIFLYATGLTIFPVRKKILSVDKCVSFLLFFFKL